MEHRLADLAPEDRDRVGRVEAMTLHRLLGWRPDNATRFRHDRGNRLKYDVVVVDESSMVELTMMARLLEAMRPQSRLVLVGDPRQLTSVGAGAVLSDLVAGYDGDPGSPVVSLTRNYRSTRTSRRWRRRSAWATGTACVDVLRGESDEVEFVETDDPEGVLRRPTPWPPPSPYAGPPRTATPRERSGRSTEHRLLCAHREGPHGVRHWNRRVERWLAEETGQEIWGEWYVGRPLLVTANDYTLHLYNGETGAAVLRDDGRLRAWISGSGGLHDFATGRLDEVETMHAMTIHKSQGSQAQADHGAAARRRLAAAHPRAVLHRCHPRAGARAGRRVGGGRPGGGGDAGAAGDRAAPAAARRRACPDRLLGTETCRQRPTDTVVADRWE